MDYEILLTMKLETFPTFQALLGHFAECISSTLSRKVSIAMHVLLFQMKSDMTLKTPSFLKK